jgi:hypothetical protein
VVRVFGLETFLLAPSVLFVGIHWILPRSETLHERE